MRFVLSPAKTLDLGALPKALAQGGARATEPAAAGRAAELAAELRGFSRGRLKALMGLSDNLAALNWERYQNFDRAEAKPAALAFAGPAYRGLRAGDLAPTELAYLQEHLCILCGLYGVLRPLDAIKPYRLEMGTKLAAGGHPDLYSFWGGQIAELCARGEPTGVLVNAASQEYWKSVDVAALPRGWRVLTVAFPGPAVHAKEARGAICRFAAVRGVTDVEDLKDFTGTSGEWAFDSGSSSDEKFVFKKAPGAPPGTWAGPAAKKPGAGGGGEEKAARRRGGQEERRGGRRREARAGRGAQAPPPGLQTPPPRRRMTPRQTGDYLNGNGG